LGDRTGKRLKSDNCSWIVEVRPTEPDNPRGKPLTSNPARDIEPVSVLKIDVCSVTAEDEPSEPVKISARPLDRSVTIEIEPVRDR